MADLMPTSCMRCGLTDEPMTNREAITHDANCRRRKGVRRDNECVIHFQSDCSPLLNACSRLTAPRT